MSPTSHIPEALLNKIQAIKTLRDRAGTDGEKDAAQHKLTLLLAKHKLTEQDIPSPSFSTRGRSSRTEDDWFARYSRERAYSSSSGNPFEDMFRNYRAYNRRAQQEQRRQREEQYQRTQQQSNPNNSPNIGQRTTKGKIKWEGELMRAFAVILSLHTWKEPHPLDPKLTVWAYEPRDNRIEQTLSYLIPHLKREAKKYLRYNPNVKNPNAFRRAFFEEATLILASVAAELTGNQERTRYLKLNRNNNIEGREAGRKAAESVRLSAFVPRQ